MNRRSFLALIGALFVPQKSKPTLGAVSSQAQDLAVKMQALVGNIAIPKFENKSFAYWLTDEVDEWVEGSVSGTKTRQYPGGILKLNSP
jgi:hypothetical protein